MTRKRLAALAGAFAAVCLLAWILLVLSGHALLVLVSLPGVAAAILLVLLCLDGLARERRLERTQREQGRILAAIDQRTRDAAPRIVHTASSVGRLAPLVREMHAASTDHARSAQAAGTGTPASPATTGRPVPDTPGVAPLPALRPPEPTPVFNDITAAVIADEFTRLALSYEWRSVAPTPDDWRELIESERPDLLFVESAWEGNGGAWRYQMTGPNAPSDALKDLVDHCRTRGIPTVFWNKEDPPHFEDFLDTASLFDWVFTTDGDLIPAYREHLGHDRVAVLPFAAEPRLHNPARVARVARDRGVVFGGMYFRHKYPERREQLDMLLPAARDFGLDIFSRQAGGDARYQFPVPYEENVRGGLPYLSMLTAYHAYKVALNVNSVVGSSTMFARRVFEATACGAAVVTPTTASIDAFFPGDLVTSVSSTQEATAEIRALTRSDEHRDRVVHRAQRHIWNTATYTHRVQDLLRRVGLPHELPTPSLSFFVSSNRPDNVRLVLENAGRQRADQKQLVLLTHGFDLDPSELRAMAAEHGLMDIVHLAAPSSSTLGDNLNALTARADGDILLRMDDDDHYGAEYAGDLVHALRFSGADLVGKAETYIHFASRDATIRSYLGHSHRHTDFVRGATFCAPRDVFAEYRFPSAVRSEDSGFLAQMVEAGASIYSADRFNYMVIRDADPSRHTWQPGERELFATGPVAFYGRDPRQVDV